MLRPRTRQAVGIIDELLGQFNRDNVYTAPSPVPFPSSRPFDAGSTGSSMRTFNKALGQFNIAQTPTPLMPPSMRPQRDTCRNQNPHPFLLQTLRLLETYSTTNRTGGRIAVQ